MRSREEHINDLAISMMDEGGRKEASYRFAQETIDEAERRAEQRVRAEISKRHTWFYMVDDPESGHADLADMLCETKPFEIVETSEAADVRIFFAYQDEDGEIHEFPNRNEAEQAVRAAIDVEQDAP
ncbi:hypothetical protein [Komagataeibacter sp. SM21]|uniref:hypothetical protein n=1 Tax=Komagataeibacter sp. SM21 TaxID=3242899 RepID=UPI003527047D